MACGRARIVASFDTESGVVDSLAQIPCGLGRQEFEADLSDAFRQMKSRQISITIKGTTGCEIAPELPVAGNDPVIVKKRYSAFFQTRLKMFSLNSGRIHLSSLARDQHARLHPHDRDRRYQRDWPVIIASDCVGYYHEEPRDYLCVICSVRLRGL